MELDWELAELVQQAFDKYILERIPNLLEKHMPIVDEIIAQRISNCSSPKINTEIFNRVESIVETTVGNYLRVGGGMRIIYNTISKYLDAKLEEHIQQELKFRMDKFVENLRKKLEI